MPIITTTNGNAAMIAIVLMPSRASSPLMASSSAATTPVSTPQNTVRGRDGCSTPRCERVPITRDAESAPETKKMPTRIITSAEATPVHGRWASTSNSVLSLAAVAGSNARVPSMS